MRPIRAHAHSSDPNRVYSHAAMRDVKWHHARLIRTAADTLDRRLLQGPGSACPSTRPLFHDAQIDELRGAVEYIGHRFPGGLQPFLALRVLLACARLLLAVEHDQDVDLAGSF
jgi:hypothetical protein